MTEVSNIVEGGFVIEPPPPSVDLNTTQDRSTLRKMRKRRVSYMHPVLGRLVHVGVGEALEFGHVPDLVGWVRVE